MRLLPLAALLLLTLPIAALCEEPATTTPPNWSGIYPHLAYFNDHGECGTGAVVPWQESLWLITYSPHSPNGSGDKLYEVTPKLQLHAFADSVGGTPANRMIHKESQQLLIGPYVIDKEKQVRILPPKKMFGRLTGTARHLTDPKNKVYYATMEEGLYEVDVSALDVTCLIRDGNRGAPQAGVVSKLPGYHGKGLYSGQGRLVYSNNGEHHAKAKVDPTIASGALAQGSGEGDWQLVRRNQFTEVTGPGGIYGNDDPESDPVWAVGWDAKSLLLAVLHQGNWHYYRLPKASHSYDGAHGWNTEWPRIREIGEDDFLMTMHGMFWRFPRTFTPENSAGIAPRSSYLKVIGDFCRWGDQVVLGCDDTAKNEFLNTRKAKGKIAGPQSQSNLWFISPEQLDQLGPVLGRGAVWLNESVADDEPSDPFLIDGFATRSLHLVSDVATTITLEIDTEGNDRWRKLLDIEVDGYRWLELDAELDASWIRLRSSAPLTKATASFHLAGKDDRPATPRANLFNGIVTGESREGENIVGGLIRARGGNKRTLQLAAESNDGKIGNYILNSQMQLEPDGDDTAWQWLQKNAAIPPREGVLEADAASVIYTDDSGRRFRLPRNPTYEQAGPLGFGRLCREVATERDLFNCHGTFFELPANNAGGFARVRPVATHGLHIYDYCSYRGLLVISGIDLSKGEDNRHIIRSDDGKAAVWVGAIDDIWQLGKPHGVGGPWKETTVKADELSDPYLMTGYDRKTLTLSASKTTTITAQIDITGMDNWHDWKTFELEPGTPVNEVFPTAFGAYWIRFQSSQPATVTAQLRYE